MACLHMKKKLSEYLDGMLPDEDRAYVEEHVASCEDCSKTLGELKNTLERLGSLGDVEPPPWFAEKVMQRVHGEAGRKSFLRKLFFPLHIKLPAEALALVMVTVVAVYVFQAVEPEVAMKEAVVSEKQVVAEKPEADISEPDAFAHRDDKAAKPFAPPSAVEPAEEAEWAQEEMGAQTDRKMAVVENEQSKMKKEAAGLMRAEPATEEYRAREEPMLMKDAAAPTVGGEASMDRLAPAGEVYEAKAALPETEPNVRLTVEVEDAEFARDELESAINDLGGRVIEDDGRPENVMLAELGADNLDKFLKELEDIGEVKSKSVMAADERLYIMIELLEGAGP